MLTRATLAVLFPFMVALIGVLAAVVGAVALFAVRPPLALLPIAALAVGLYLFARWERTRFRPPGV